MIQNGLSSDNHSVGVAISLCVQVRWFIVVAITLVICANSPLAVMRFRDLDNPSVRYVLEQTPEGEALLNAQAATHFGVGHLPKDKQVRLFILRLTETELGEYRRAFEQLSEARFVHKPNPDYHAPLHELDRVLLRHTAQDLFGNRNVLVSDHLSTFRNDSVKGRFWSERYNEWIKWAEDSRTKGSVEARAAKLFQVARQMFDDLGIAYKVIELQNGKAAFQIEGGTGNRLNLLAQGLNKNLSETGLIYSPHELLSSPAKGRYLPASKSVLLPHAAILNGGAEEITVHELLHASLNDQLRRGTITPFHGAIVSRIPKNASTPFPYASGRMSLEELATFAISLQNSAIKLKHFESMRPAERASLLGMLTHSARRGEVASAYAREICESAKVLLLRQPKKISYHVAEFGRSQISYAELKFTFSQTGQEITMQLPLAAERLSRVQAEKRLFEVLEERSRLYAEMAQDFTRVNTVLGSSLTQASQIELLKNATIAPRRTSMTYLRETKNGCLTRSLSLAIRR